MPVARQYLRLMLIHLVHIRTCALSATVFLGAPRALIHSSYASETYASLCMRANLSNLEFLKANVWKYLNPRMDLTDAKNMFEYMTSFMRCGLRVHTLVLYWSRIYSLVSVCKVWTIWVVFTKVDLVIAYVGKPTRSPSFNFLSWDCSCSPGVGPLWLIW